jgi:PAS domain S-box-containing protein
MERVRNPKVLRAAGAIHRALRKAIPDLIFHLDDEGRFLDFMPAKGQVPAIPPTEFLGRTVSEVLPEDLARRMMRHIGRALQTGKTQVFEYKLPVPLPSGNLRDYEARIVKCGDNEVLGIVRDVTGHRQAREALRASEARYRHVFEHVHDVFYRADMNGAFTETSPSIERWGYDPEQLIGVQVADVYENPQERLAFLSALLEQGRVIDYEVRLKTGDGRVIDASVSSYLLRDPDGVVVGIEGIARDITKRKSVEEALREAEERLRTLVANAPVTLFAIDREGVFTVAEGRAMDLTGLRADEYIGRSVFDMYRDVPGVIDAARRALGGEAFTTKVETGERVFEAHVSPVRDADSMIAGAVAVATDITGRHRAEEMLRIQRDLALALCATTDLQDTLRLCLQAAIRLSGLDSGCVYLADKSSGAFDLTCHEGLGDSFVESIARYEGDSANVRRVMTGKPIYTRYQELGVHMDEPRLREGLRAIAVVPVQHGGEIIACLCITSHTLDDIPSDSRSALEAVAGQVGNAVARSRGDESLRESEERFRRLSEATLGGIIIHDHGLILDANPQVAAMLGYELPEMIGKNAFSFLTPESRDLARQHVASGYENAYEVWGLRKDGTTFPMEVCGKTTSYEGRSVRMGVMLDISERKRAEEAAQAAREELESRAEHAMRRGNASGLTFRELTVLYLMVAGRADKEIAFQLGISSRTASKHVENILQKMGVASRTEASVRALREGLVGDAH